MTPEQEAKTMRKALKAHTDYVKSYLVLIDDAMRKPDSVERGKRIAHLSNILELKNDSVRRFTLELGFNRKPLKRGAKKSA